MAEVRPHKDKMTPDMVAKVENEVNFLFVDGFLARCRSRNYCRNLEGTYAYLGGRSAMFDMPYNSLFLGSLIETMAAEPDAPLARRFRMYVEHRLMPAMAELAELLHENGSLLEWPAAAEMAEMFPYIHPATSREMLMFLFRSHYQAWCAVPTVYDIPRRHPYSLRAGVAAKACPT